MVGCGCGRQYADVSRLRKVGWQPDLEGGALLLVECTCGSTFAAARLSDASFCDECGRMMHDEVKVCAENYGVLCIPCARRVRLVQSR
jgi:hypothetical protein